MRDNGGFETKIADKCSPKKGGLKEGSEKILPSKLNEKDVGQKKRVGAFGGRFSHPPF